MRFKFQRRGKKTDIIGIIVQSVSLLVLCIAFFFPTTASQAQQETDLVILDTLNQYVAATAAQELCGTDNFSSVEEQKKYDVNFVAVMASAVGAFQRLRADLSSAQVSMALGAMHENTRAKLIEFHKQSGCKHEIVKAALLWHKNFRSLPPL